MTKYAKKPVVIEAMKLEFTTDSQEQIIRWSNNTIKKGLDGGLIIATLEGNMTANTGDFIIKGVNGEFYPCKPDIFEKTYRKSENTGLNFGQAIEALKTGEKVARTGWNGKNMFLFLLPAGTIPKIAIHDEKLREVLENNGKDSFDALGSIRMKTADDKILTGWLASQTDMLADDWCIIE